MVRRRRVHFIPLGGMLSDTAILSICFLLGSAAGTLLCAHLSEAAHSSLAASLEGWVSTMGQAGVSASWLNDLVRHLRFPLLALVLSGAPIGVVGVPAVFFARGLLLSFTAAAFLHAYAYKGIAAAAVLYGPAEAVSVLALFAAGAFAFARAVEHAASPGGRRRAPVEGSPAPALMLCAAAGVISLLQSWGSPLTVRLLGLLIG